MLSRVLLSVLVMLMAAVGGQAQTCGTGSNTLERCVVTTMNSTGLDGSAAVLTLSFRYCAPNQGSGLAFGTGPITSFTLGSLTVAPGNNAFAVSAFTGSVTTVLAGAPIVTTGNSAILTFSPDTMITVVDSNGNSFTSVLTSNSPVYAFGVDIPSLPNSVLPTSLTNMTQVTLSQCGDVAGDPLFAGFNGQQFYVGGEDGQVMNLLSTFNMQLNGRFVDLQEGATIMPAEQEKLRLLSLAEQKTNPSLTPLPNTLPWSHPGNYFGEMGVALLDDNRIYAKAGAYETGFSKVALNGRQLPVSDDFVVLGQGLNATYIQRTSASELLVRSVNVEFTITNSASFLNIENIHLEKGSKKYNKFDGLYGKTADAKWSWNTADEKAAVVESNDLFARTAIEA